MEPNPAHGAAAPEGESINVSAVRPVRTRFVALALMLFVALLAGTFLVGLAPQKSRKDRLADTAALLDATPVVNVAKPSVAPPQDELRLAADVRAYAEATLEARATGYLKALHADLGDHVKEGELLAEIDAPDLDAELKRAQATSALAQTSVAKATNDLDLAKTTLARYEGFAQKGGVTPQDLDEKRSNATQAEVALATARASVAASEAEVARLATLQKFQRISAPFSGIVTARDLDVGTLLPSGAAGHVLFRLARTDVVRVFVDVPQGDATAVVVGADAMLTVRNHPGREFTGKIARTTGALDPATRTLRIQIDVQNGEGLLLPGMYGEARLKLARKRGRATVPTGALVFDGQGTHVWTVRDGKAARIDVVLGIDFGTTIEVENGIAEDADVVTNPSERLVEGGAVRVAGRK
jgi:membrane fusion protein (multidrug efflux system)